MGIRPHRAAVGERRQLRSGDAVFCRDLLADVSVFEAELVAAVMANSHGGRTKANHFNLMGVASLGGMSVITTMNRDERCSHDGIRTVRTHPTSIGRPIPSDKPAHRFACRMTPTD